MQHNVFTEICAFVTTGGNGSSISSVTGNHDYASFVVNLTNKR